MADVGELDFQGFVSERERRRAGRAGGDDRAYAYSSDRATRQAFEALRPVKYAVSSAVRMWKSVGRNELLGSAVKVGPSQFPRLHGLLSRCADTLGVVTPTLYVTNNPVTNATTFGTNDDSIIIVHSALVDYFTDDELLSVLGHEVGHIHNEHVVYLTALYYLKGIATTLVRWAAAPAMLALSGWSRRAELTADRAGMLCCGSFDVSARALAKLALGSRKLFADLNLDAFMDQYEQGQTGVGRFAELAADHPWLPKRLRALRVFSESELFRASTGAGAGGLSMADVDAQSHDLIKVIG